MLLRAAARTFRAAAPAMLAARAPAARTHRFAATAAAAGIAAWALHQAARQPMHCDGGVKVTTIAGTEGGFDERTFIMLKPDGVQRGLLHDVIRRFSQRGYKLVAIKTVMVSEEHARAHYADLSSKPFFPGLVKYISSGTPVVAMVWEGPNVIKQGRVMVGATNPQAAAPGTFRYDHCVTIGRNTIHASDSFSAATDEISLWFKPDEIMDYNMDIAKWVLADN